MKEVGNYLFRLSQFELGGRLPGAKMLLLAAQSDFAKGIQKLQLIALLIAIAAGAVFLPGVWIFGSRMSRSLKAITAQAGMLQMLAAPNDCQSPRKKGRRDSRTRSHHEHRATRNLVIRTFCSLRSWSGGLLEQFDIH